MALRPSIASSITFAVLLLLLLGLVAVSPRVLAIVPSAQQEEIGLNPPTSSESQDQAAPAPPSVAEAEPIQAAQVPAPPTLDQTAPESKILQPLDGSHVKEGQPLDVTISADDADGRVS